MNRKSSPKAVRLGLHRAVDKGLEGAVYWAVYRATSGAVKEAVYWTVDDTVGGAVYWAVNGAVDEAVNDPLLRAMRAGHPHPNLHLFVAEIQQVRGSVL